MSSTEEQALVKIGDETFKLLEIPSPKTALVQREKERLLGVINLSTFVDDLGQVGSFVRVAYNGVAGYTDLQISIREIGVDVTKLCDKSAVTVSKFQSASDTILKDLQSTYQFLIDGLENIALATLSAIADIAKDLATAAKKLQNDFEIAAEKVEQALKETMTKKGSEVQRKEELKKMEQKLTISRLEAEQNKKSSEDTFKMLEEKYKKAEAKQESLEASAKNPVKALLNVAVNMVKPNLGGQNLKLFDTEADKTDAECAAKEKMKFYEEMMKQKEARKKALQDLAVFSKQIEDCKDDADLAEAAIKALHKAISGLQHLSAVMMKAALFWTQMQMHCESLAKDKVKKIIEAGMKLPQDERIRVWTAYGFKKQAIEYYGCWVALDDVCKVYMKRIQETQNDLYGYLTENPTTEQARKNVRELAAIFAKDLANAQKAIDDKAAEDYEKILELEA